MMMRRGANCVLLLMPFINMLATEVTAKNIFKPLKNIREFQAYRVYEEGAQKGLFLSKYQRSLYNVESLKSRPWWTAEQTGYAKYLKVGHIVVSSYRN